MSILQLQKPLLDILFRKDSRLPRSLLLPPPPEALLSRLPLLIRTARTDWGPDLLRRGLALLQPSTTTRFLRSSNYLHLLPERGAVEQRYGTWLFFVGCV